MLIWAICPNGASVRNASRSSHHRPKSSIDMYKPSRRPEPRCTASSSAASATVRVIGFCSSTCLPLRNSAAAWAACRKFGVLTTA